jgi:hypothetical protein
MERIAKERGFYSILEMSWFCFEPLKGYDPAAPAIPASMQLKAGWPGASDGMASSGTTQRR